MKIYYALRCTGKSKLPEIIKQHYKPTLKPKWSTKVWLDECTG